MTKLGGIFIVLQHTCFHCILSTFPEWGCNISLILNLNMSHKYQILVDYKNKTSFFISIYIFCECANLTDVLCHRYRRFVLKRWVTYHLLVDKNIDINISKVKIEKIVFIPVQPFSVV